MKRGISYHHHRPKHINFQYIHPISYKIAKKGKPGEMDLSFLKNDITTIFYRHDTCVIADTYNRC